MICGQSEVNVGLSPSFQSSNGSFSQKLWLGVAARCISLYRQGEAEALESFPYGQICSYGVFDNNTFKITAGDRDLLFETSKVLANVSNSCLSKFISVSCIKTKPIRYWVLCVVMVLYKSLRQDRSKNNNVLSVLQRMTDNHVRRLQCTNLSSGTLQRIRYISTTRSINEIT